MTALLDQNSIFGLLQGRPKALPTSQYSYQLPEGAMAPLGLDTVSTAKDEFDEGRMSVWIPVVDGNRRDGVGDLFEVQGLDLSRHRVNPIVLFDHGKGDYKFANWPIALEEDPGTGGYTFEVDPVAKTGKGNAFFYQGKGIPGADRKDEQEFALMCEQLYHMRCKRYIRSGSIGYQIVQARRLEGDYETGTPAGLHLIRTLKLESSLVVLPANMDTVAKVLSMPKVCGKRLSPYLVKSLQPYAPPKRATLFLDGAPKDVKMKSLKAKYGVKWPSDQVKNAAVQAIKKSAAAGLTAVEAVKAAWDHMRKTAGEQRHAENLENNWGEYFPVLCKLADEIYQELNKHRADEPVVRRKHMPTQELKRKVKAAPDDMPPPETPTDSEGLPPEEPEAQAPDEPQSEEKYGAQLVRMIHGHAQELLELYDEAKGPLEHAPTQKLIDKKCQQLVKEIGELESHFENHYPEEHAENPLSGQGDVDPDGGVDEGDTEGDTEGPDDTDADTESADSSPKETPPTEDAVEGMGRGDDMEKDNKRLRRRLRKALRSKYGKDFGAPDRADDAADVTEPAAPTEVPPGPQGGVDLLPHHKSNLKEAHSHLHELAEAPELQEEHRMKSYHFHKNLEEIAGHLTPRQPAMHEGAPGTADTKCVKCGKPHCSCGRKDFPEETAADDTAEVQHPDSNSEMHVKALKSASGYLKHVSTSRDWGENQRQEAAVHYKALAPLTEAIAQSEVQHPDSGVGPGTAGEKSLAEQAIAQQNQTNELLKGIDRLKTLLKN